MKRDAMFWFICTLGAFLGAGIVAILYHGLVLGDWSFAMVFFFAAVGGSIVSMMTRR